MRVYVSQSISFDNCLLFSLSRSVSPPAKQLCLSEETEDAVGSDAAGDLPDLIQGEIARLHPRFVVALDPAHHPWSKVVQLLCRIGEYIPVFSVHSFSFAIYNDNVFQGMSKFHQ